MWRTKGTDYKNYNVDEPPLFEPGPPALSWLDTFASKRNHKSVDHTPINNLEEMFPWLWNPAWCDAVSVDVEGVKQLKSAVRHANSMVHSLDTFFQCAKDRLGRLQNCLKAVAAQTYFHLLSDNILAVIFEFVSLPNAQQVSEGGCDYKAATMISLVSRRFRKVALRVPRLWRFIRTKQSPSDIEVFLSRSVSAGPILEVYVDSEGEDDWVEKCDLLLTRVGRDMTFASRITRLRFDFCRENDYDRIVGFAEEMEDFKALTFPSLHELIINYDYGRTGDNVHFYQLWKLPALKVIGARNVLLILSKQVLAGVLECSLHFEEYEDESEPCWKYEEVLKFVDSLSGLKRLDMMLDGTAFNNDADNGRCPSFSPKRSIEHLRLAVPRTEASCLRSLFEAFRTPEKKSWTLEIDSDGAPGESPLACIFPPVAPGHRTKVNKKTGYHNMKEFNLVIRIDSQSKWDGVDCNHLWVIPRHATGLEKFSVSYITAQSRKFEFKNCEGRVEELMEHMESEVGRDPGGRNSCIVFDGSAL